MSNIIPSTFIIRVYALIINSKNQILLCDEERFGIKMTKFPGGGLNFGEGPENCLKREMREETKQEIEIIEHFYTTGFFQQSWFDENQQLISIYYRVKFIEEEKFMLTLQPLDFENKEKICFRYRSLDQLSPDELTLPVDRYVLQLLKKSE